MQNTNYLMDVQVGFGSTRIGAGRVWVGNILTQQITSWFRVE